MKINKRTSMQASVLSLALLATGICFSADIDKEIYSARCEHVHMSLDEMLEEHESAPCADKVQYSSYVMEGAAMLFHHNRYEDALYNLKIADRSLSAIYFKSQECVYFSPKVKPLRDEVKLLLSEFKNIPME